MVLMLVLDLEDPDSKSSSATKLPGGLQVSDCLSLTSLSPPSLEEGRYKNAHKEVKKKKTSKE